MDRVSLEASYLRRTLDPRPQPAETPLLAPRLTTYSGFPLSRQGRGSRWGAAERRRYPIVSAASALFRATAPASAPSAGTVASPPRLSGSLSLPPEELGT